MIRAEGRVYTTQSNCLVITSGDVPSLLAVVVALFFLSENVYTNSDAQNRNIQVNEN
jgi:hypothetical protein